MLLRAPPSTPIRMTVTDSSSSSSIDDELAKVTNESLSMGTSIVKNMDNISFVLPPRHKLHFGLYINTSTSPEINKSSSVTATANSLKYHLESMQLGEENTANGSDGVPGFPDFPACWNGGTPSTPKASNRNSNNRQTNKFSTSKSNQKRCHRRIRRTAVNIPFGSSSSSSTTTRAAAVSLSPGRAMKKCARNERKLRRIAKVVQLKERRRRKKDIGDICRGMAAIKW